MPSHVISNSALERQLLIQLGGRLRTARTHQGWTASQVAERAGISRTTRVLTRDQASLALVRDLRVLLVDVIQVLEDDPVLPGAVEVLTAADASSQLPER